MSELIVQVDKNQVYIDSNNDIFVNGKNIPHEVWKNVNVRKPNVFIKNASEFYAFGNKIMVNGDSVFVNDVEITDEIGAKIPMTMTRVFIESKSQVRKERKVLIKKINEGKGIGKSILKNSDTNLLRRLARLDDRWFTEVPRYQYYKGKMNFTASTQKSIDPRKTATGLSIGALGLTAGTCSTIMLLKNITTPLILGSVCGFAGAALALGATIPNIIKGQKRRTTNMRQLSQNLLEPIVATIEEEESNNPNALSDRLNKAQKNAEQKNDEKSSNSSGRSL